MTATQQSEQVRTILVVEDETAIAQALAQRINAYHSNHPDASGIEERWQAYVVSDGEAAVQAAHTVKPALIIMDIMLPKMDGIEASRLIRNEQATPIIMLTARDSVDDKVNGLGAGADDYMTKPFSARELMARCKALLSRIDRARQVATESEHEKPLEFPSLLIYPDEQKVLWKGEQVHLTHTEFALLYELASKPGTVFSRELLLQRVWGWSTPAASESRTVDSHIKALRQKFGTNFIRTIRGTGYAFEQSRFA